MINNDLQSSYVRHTNLWHSARTPVPQVAAVVVQVAEPNWLASRLPHVGISMSTKPQKSAMKNQQ